MVTLTLVPSHQSAIPTQFRIDLYNGDYAIISAVDTGWMLQVYRGGMPPVDRGLFGSPDDAREVLRAEVTERFVQQGLALARARQGDPQPRGLSS
jgi:hypothetical protein